MKMSKPVLVTGGAGYIGAHTAKALAAAGFTPVVFDNLSNGHKAAVRWGDLVVGDIRDEDLLYETLASRQIRHVINFAGLIEVGRSVAEPELFWEHNVFGLLQLLKAARRAKVERLVFSSSAAVYGQQDLASIPESAAKLPTSPYGETKLAGEQMIAAACRAHGLSAVALRYFNAAGADDGGEIGEAHQPETHLIPLAIGAALGTAPPLTLFGEDFPTRDGTCLRDYIHVTDLAAAHVAALEVELSAGAFEALNVGCGVGRSVREVIAGVDKVLGLSTPFTVGPRRAGDPAALVADPKRAGQVLNWTARRSDLGDIIASAAAWHRRQAY